MGPRVVYGLVVEEAMASGLPVISSEAAGDIKLRAPEGVAGYVVPQSCPEVLADRMLHDRAGFRRNPTDGGCGRGDRERRAT